MHAVKEKKLARKFPLTISETPKEADFVSVSKDMYRRLLDRGLMFQLLLDNGILTIGQLKIAKEDFLHEFDREFSG